MRECVNACLCRLTSIRRLHQILLRQIEGEYLHVDGSERRGDERKVVGRGGGQSRVGNEKREV